MEITGKFHGIQNGTRFKMGNNVNKQLLPGTRFKMGNNLKLSEMAWPYCVVQGLQFFIRGNLFPISALFIYFFLKYIGQELNCTPASVYRTTLLEYIGSR